MFVLSALLIMRLTWLVSLPQFIEHLMSNFPRSRLFFCSLCAPYMGLWIDCLANLPAFNWFQIADCVSVCWYMCIHTYTDKHCFLICIHVRNINICALVFLPDSFLRKWDFENALKRTKCIDFVWKSVSWIRGALLAYPNHTTSGCWFSFIKPHTYPQAPSSAACVENQ